MDIKQVAGSGVVSRSSSAPRETPALPPVSTATPAPTPEQLELVVKEIQRSVGGNTTNLTFSVDTGSGRTVVTVMDSETKEVVRQLPSEEALRISRTLDRMQGLLINGKA